MELSPAVFLTITALEAGFSYVVLLDYLPFKTIASVFLLCATINSIALLINALIIYPYFRTPLRHLPIPKKGFYPVIGHGLIVLKRPPGQPHLELIRDTPNDGLIYIRGFMHEDRLILTSPAAFADVLVHKCYDFEKPAHVRGFLRQFLGDGLLMTEGEEHKYQRKQIMPAFTFRHIKDLYPVFWSKSIELCEVVKAELQERSDKTLEIGHFTTKVTMDIIGLAGLGRDIGSLKTSDDELVQNFEEILEPTIEKALYFISHVLFPIWFIKALPWRMNKVTKVTSRNLRRICTDLVKEKKAKFKVEGEEAVDILSILIRSNSFSDDGLVDQLLTFVAAGHETTSSTLTWATYLLATHPRAQKRLREEVHHNITDKKALLAPGFEIAGLLESLPFLNAVCNETLRLYPTLPITTRVARCDTSINGHFVPKDTVSFIVPWATNRDTKLWGEDAEIFNPERWLDPGTGRANFKGSAESNYSFLTFLHGPRSCIGQNFARAEFRALLAAFAGSFEFEMANSNEKVKVGGTITAKPINGMRLRLDPVEW